MPSDAFRRTEVSTRCLQLALTLHFRYDAILQAVSYKRTINQLTLQALCKTCKHTSAMTFVPSRERKFVYWGRATPYEAVHCGGTDDVEGCFLWMVQTLVYEKQNLLVKRYCNIFQKHLLAQPAHYNITLPLFSPSIPIQYMHTQACLSTLPTLSPLLYFVEELLFF